MQASKPQGAVILVFYSQKSGISEKVLDSSTFTVGRDLGCGVSIPDLTISRNHLKVYFLGDHIEVEDLGSANGSVYQGHQLPHGQRIRYELEEKIRIGLYDTHIWFDIEHPEAEEVAAPSSQPVAVLQPPPSDHLEKEDKTELSEPSLVGLLDENTPPPAPATKSNINVVRIQEPDRSAEFKKKEEVLVDRLRELESEIDESIRQRDQILIQANRDAEAIRANASQESYDMLARTRDTAALIRKTAEDESRIFKNKKIKELEALAKSADERAAEIIKSAETRKAEVLRNAEVVLQEATRDAQDRLAHANSLLAKVEVEAKAEKDAILARFKTEIDTLQNEKNSVANELGRLKDEHKDAAQHLADLKSEAEREKFELKRLQGDHAQKLNLLNEFESSAKTLKDEIAASQKQHADLLNQVSDLQRKNEAAIKKAKEQGEELLSGYDKALNERLAKENQIIEQKRLELNRELSAEEEKMRAAFAERSRNITRNLVKFLQIYHLEHKTFDLKTMADKDLEQFEDHFHDNILLEAKVGSDQAQMVGGKVRLSKELKRYAFASISFTALVLAVPQFLPQPHRARYSIIDRIDSTSNADRMIASLKSDRDRRYTPEKVEFVFDNFSTNAIYAQAFADKWLSDGYQRKWSTKLQAHFYKKYRISEEIMIQVASKESALVSSFKKTAEEIHPDFFKVQFAKMQKDEAELNEDVRRLLNNEVAYRDYRQMVFQYFAANKD